jgi:hypothetical protein
MSRLDDNSVFMLFIGGGLFISLGDRVHIAFDLFTEKDQSWWGQSWWIVPMFGVVTVALYDGYRLLRRSLGEAPQPPSALRTATSSALFLAAYACTGPLDAWGLWLGGLLTLLWIPRVVALGSRAAVILSLILAVVGPVGEALLSSTGLFAYDHPDLGLVPSWLFGIYLHGALAMVQLEALVGHWVKKGDDSVDQQPSET